MVDTYRLVRDPIDRAKSLIGIGSAYGFSLFAGSTESRRWILHNINTLLCRPYFAHTSSAACLCTTLCRTHDREPIRGECETACRRRRERLLESRRRHSMATENKPHPPIKPPPIKFEAYTVQMYCYILRVYHYSKASTFHDGSVRDFLSVRRVLVLRGGFSGAEEEGEVYPAQRRQPGEQQATKRARVELGWWGVLGWRPDHVRSWANVCVLVICFDVKLGTGRQWVP